MTGNKATCTVLHMPALKPKPRQSTKKGARSRKNPFVLGKDGRTANDRFREAILEPGLNYSEGEFVRTCNRLWGLAETADPPAVSQQMLNQIRNDRIDLARSSFVGLIAEGLGVRAVWLQRGTGTKFNDPTITRKLVDFVKSQNLTAP